MLRIIQTSLAITAVALLIADGLLGAVAYGAEKFVLHASLYRTKAELLEVGDPEGHRVGVSDWIGITFNDAGHGFLHTAQYLVKATSGGNKASPTAGGFKIFTMKDGAKVYATFEQTKVLADGAEGTFRFMGGAGKFDGIKGGGSYRIWVVSPGLLWDRLEGEYETGQ